MTDLLEVSLGPLRDQVIAAASRRYLQTKAKYLMPFQFRVVDLTNDVIEMDQIIDGAASPEEAGRVALGFDVVRSGTRADLVARVYWQPLGRPVAMVRLYRKVTQEDSRSSIA